MTISLVKPNRPRFTDVEGLAAMVGNGDVFGVGGHHFARLPIALAARHRRVRRQGFALRLLGRRSAARTAARGGSGRGNRHLLFQPGHLWPAAAVPCRRRDQGRAGSRLDGACHDPGAAGGAAEPAIDAVPDSDRLRHDGARAGRDRQRRSHCWNDHRIYPAAAARHIRRPRPACGRERQRRDHRAARARLRRWPAQRGKCWSRSRRSSRSGRCGATAARASSPAIKSRPSRWRRAAPIRPRACHSM